MEASKLTATVAEVGAAMAMREAVVVEAVVVTVAEVRAEGTAVAEAVAPVRPEQAIAI